MDLHALLDTYRVDLAHARHVADQSLALFDAVRQRYDLPASARRLIEVGALLHNVGMTTDPPAHHLVGRDIVLRHVLEDLGQRDQALLACMVAFHRKKVRPQLEPAFLSLGKKGQALALQLSAILRVGDGLDYSQSQGTQLVGLEPCADGLALGLSGPHAAGDGARAVAKADLWRKVFGEALVAPPATVPAPSEVLPVALPAEGPAADIAALPAWYASPEAPLAELGRVLLRRHLRRLLSAERDVRADEEIEAVHALRVATRRLRAALRMLAPVGPAGLRAQSKTVGRLARVAGAVRDLDVLLADLSARAGDLPAELQPGLDSLRAALGAERAAAYDRLIARLDSAEHADFKRTFADLITSHDGWDDRPRVRDMAGSTLWQQYEALRAYDRGGLPVADEGLHAMRIAGKRMRYLLELFAETLGDRADLVVEPLISFQDYVGALQDAVVARTVVLDHAHGDAAQAAAVGYLALRDRDVDERRGALPIRWEKVSSGTYRRNLMGLIVKL